ncbi:hypothetical protein GWK08_08660 [Leptobacterium flavescens]|uniref:Uncharacterized protein n=1 Tax=Leptobacterium flavescens TaxID=472055 RepID=A0A6P0UJM4_9FLAO|nr:hypothetical protein [Leptobacterium flavescens]NER13505.1 hypothetical protein [Leptobacterium flavescens]
MRLAKFFFTIFTMVALTAFVGCSSDDDNDTTVQVSINGTVLFDNGDDFNGDVDGDFTGTGGSVTRTFLWRNNLTTADYNADITATTEGTFNMTVRDADENIVLNRSLDGATEPDSFSGVTESGTSGVWSVTITLGSFTGDGSFSLSEGN